jgi:hypothetical protein
MAGQPDGDRAVINLLVARLPEAERGGRRFGELWL